MNRKCGVCGGPVCPHCGHSLPKPLEAQPIRIGGETGTRGATWSINQTRGK